MNAKSITNHLWWIATVATFVIGCVDIKAFQPSATTAKSKEDRELTIEFARMWDNRFVVVRPEISSEFQANLQDSFLGRASNLQIDFLRRAFEQLFAPFVAGVGDDHQYNRSAATEGLRDFS